MQLKKLCLYNDIQILLNKYATERLVTSLKTLKC